MAATPGAKMIDVRPMAGPVGNVLRLNWTRIPPKRPVCQWCKCSRSIRYSNLSHGRLSFCSGVVLATDGGANALVIQTPISRALSGGRRMRVWHSSKWKVITADTRPGAAVSLLPLVAFSSLTSTGSAHRRGHQKAS
jgi:hypothetical protein